MHLSTRGAHNNLRVVFFHLVQERREGLPAVLAQGVNFLALRILFAGPWHPGYILRDLQRGMHSYHMPIQ